MRGRTEVQLGPPSVVQLCGCVLHFALLGVLYIGAIRLPSVVLCCWLHGCVFAFCTFGAVDIITSRLPCRRYKCHSFFLIVATNLPPSYRDVINRDSVYVSVAGVRNPEWRRVTEYRVNWKA